MNGRLALAKRKKKKAKKKGRCEGEESTFDWTSKGGQSIWRERTAKEKREAW